MKLINIRTLLMLQINRLFNDQNKITFLSYRWFCPPTEPTTRLPPINQTPINNEELAAREFSYQLRFFFSLKSRWEMKTKLELVTDIWLMWRERAFVDDVCSIFWNEIERKTRCQRVFWFTDYGWIACWTLRFVSGKWQQLKMIFHVKVRSAITFAPPSKFSMT